MDADHPVWVAEESETIVGVVSAHIREHFTGQADCYLGELVVRPAAEGRGIGRQLVATVEAWAVERDVQRVTLETGAANHRAREFYECLGYLEEQVQLTKVISKE
jgi:GNAT superfamily N-acetyltransferase